MTELIWSFSPWLAFLLGARVGSLYAAVTLGAAVAIIITGRAIHRRQVHLLDAGSLCYFVILGAILIIIHPGHLDFWSRYAQAGSHTALTLIVFGSILVGRPFTESYAREKTPPAIWHTPEFHAVNRRISAVWGLAFLAGTISLIAAGSVTDRQVLLRVIVPFGALLLAYQYTQKQTKPVPDVTTAAEPEPGDPGTPAGGAPGHTPRSSGTSTEYSGTSGHPRISRTPRQPIPGTQPHIGPGDRSPETADRRLARS